MYLLWDGSGTDYSNTWTASKYLPMSDWGDAESRKSVWSTC